MHGFTYIERLDENIIQMCTGFKQGFVRCILVLNVNS